eukprot:365109-Chlamydomonas_euryale.AAC.3
MAGGGREGGETGCSKGRGNAAGAGAQAIGSDGRQCNAEASGRCMKRHYSAYCMHAHKCIALARTLIMSLSSAAKSQSLQRSPLTRPRPGSTAPPGYWWHTRKGCTT